MRLLLIFRYMLYTKITQIFLDINSKDWTFWCFRRLIIIIWSIFWTITWNWEIFVSFLSRKCRPIISHILLFRWGRCDLERKLSWRHYFVLQWWAVIRVKLDWFILEIIANIGIIWFLLWTWLVVDILSWVLVHFKYRFKYK